MALSRSLCYLCFLRFQDLNAHSLVQDGVYKVKTNAILTLINQNNTPLNYG